VSGRHTRVVRSTDDGRVAFELFASLTEPPVVQLLMSPDETDEVAQWLSEASADARHRGGVSDD
jgi:hypothetical protein